MTTLLLSDNPTRKEVYAMATKGKTRKAGLGFKFKVKALVHKLRWTIHAILLGSGNDVRYINRHMLRRITSLYEENEVLNEKIRSLRYSAKVTEARMKKIKSDNEKLVTLYNIIKNKSS
jgi:hypothetical protein